MRKHVKSLERCLVHSQSSVVSSCCYGSCYWEVITGEKHAAQTEHDWARSCLWTPYSSVVRGKKEGNCWLCGKMHTALCLCLQVSGSRSVLHSLSHTHISAAPRRPCHPTWLTMAASFPSGSEAPGKVLRTHCLPGVSWQEPQAGHLRLLHQISTNLVV